jgi:hypothetical protein
MNKRLISRTRARLLPFSAGAALALAGIAGTIAAPAIASAATNSPATVVPGEVLKLSGTPNLWIVDYQGVAHFASDPQALAGRTVNWGTEVELSADQLAAVSRGTPWLSQVLVKMGDSIYLARPGAAPMTSASELDSDGVTVSTGVMPAAAALLHVPSAYDLSLLGVTPENYGLVVLDRAEWEQLYGISLQNAPVIGDMQISPADFQVPPAASAPDSSMDESGD